MRNPARNEHYAYDHYMMLASSSGTCMRIIILVTVGLVTLCRLACAIESSTELVPGEARACDPGREQSIGLSGIAAALLCNTATFCLSACALAVMPDATHARPRPAATV